VRKLFLAWQNHDTREWRPVGQLTLEEKRYSFRYTQGAKRAKNFIPFGRMQDLNTIYESAELFPLFANRILSKTRPEYHRYLEWLKIPRGNDEPLALLSRTGGQRGTDSLVVFACPEPRGGKYLVDFFCHGISHLPQESLKIIEGLGIGTRLHLMLDVQNEFDRMAVALRPETPRIIVGYVPRYFAADFAKLVTGATRETVNVFVEGINQDAPIQLRLLCRISAEWPKRFRPCSGKDFEPIVKGDVVQKRLKNGKAKLLGS
jgi:HIRAN domain-containing protein